MAKLLIDSGADLNAYDKAFGTILHNTIRQDHPEMAKLLVGSGATLDQRDPSDSTELHPAAIRGYADLAQLLIERDADLEADGAKVYHAGYHATVMDSSR